MRLAPGAACAALAGCGAAALLTRHALVAGAIAGGLLLACLRGPRRARRTYLAGVLVSGAGVLVLSPLLQVTGEHALWTGPTLPVLGPLDVTREELALAALNGLRLTAVGLAFGAYALLVDHDALVRSVRVGRRSALAVVLATRLIPTLERDAVRYTEAIRGRGIELRGARAHARLLSPLVAGSLERALGLAEAMEARGYGRPGTTLVPRPAWRAVDRVVASGAAILVLAALLWL